MNLPDFSSQTPRAIAMDLDETTLNSDAKLAERTRVAIHAVRQLGLPVIIATSRPERVLPVLVTDDVLQITSLVQMNGTIAEGKAGCIQHNINIVFSNQAERLPTAFRHDRHRQRGPPKTMKRRFRQ
jgi:hydroxymethylpyrimidine pyrophosphatase-like HAD family hydrolase